MPLRGHPTGRGSLPPGHLPGRHPHTQPYACSAGLPCSSQSTQVQLLYALKHQYALKKSKPPKQAFRLFRKIQS